MITVKQFQDVLSEIQVSKEYKLLNTTKNAIRHWNQSLLQYSSADSINKNNCIPPVRGNIDLIILVVCDLARRFQKNEMDICGDDIKILRETVLQKPLTNISPDIATIYTQSLDEHYLFINIANVTPTIIKDSVKNFYGEKLTASQIWSLATESITIPSVIDFLVQEHGPQIASIYLAFAPEIDFFTSERNTITSDILFTKMFNLHPAHASHWVQAIKWLDTHRDVNKPWKTLSPDRKKTQLDIDILIPALELYGVETFRELMTKTNIVADILNSNKAKQIDLDEHMIETLNSTITK